jgi:hypothetical protein
MYIPVQRSRTATCITHSFLHFYYYRIPVLLKEGYDTTSNTKNLLEIIAQQVQYWKAHLILGQEWM